MSQQIHSQSRMRQCECHNGEERREPEIFVKPSPWFEHYFDRIERDEQKSLEWLKTASQ
jgi:hypothetical protein